MSANDAEGGAMDEKIPGPDRPTLCVRARVLWRPKHGHRDDEYEDAWRLSDEGARPWSAAIADGATESAFAGLWARVLVEGIVAEVPAGPDDLCRAIPCWRTAWQAVVDRRAPALPWYAAAKAEQGGFATLLGFTLDAGGAWQALSVGDCGLFHLRDGRLLAAWPIDDPDAFTHHPELVDSRPGRPLPPVAYRRGTAQPGDAFLLATDAAAAWLLRGDPYRVLGIDPDTWVGLAEAARQEGTLRNDDLTIVVIEIDAT